MTTPLYGPNLPRYAIAGTLGRVKIISYWKAGYFFVLDNKDNRYFRHRDALVFLAD